MTSDNDTQNPMRPMNEAPQTGKHVILAIQSGCFIYNVQGCYDVSQNKWVNCLGIDVEPLCWMPNVRLPKEFLPEGFK